MSDKDLYTLYNTQGINKSNIFKKDIDERYYIKMMYELKEGIIELKIDQKK